MAGPRRNEAPRVDVTRAACIVVVCGSSGSGKSAWVKQQLRRSGARRVLVWDVDEEYSGEPGFTAVREPAALAALLQRAHAAKIAYVPGDPDQFEFWCRCVFAWGECTAVAEEIADVTHPGKAPPGWGQLVRRGRKRGVSLYAVTQRPSESDKTVLGNRSLLHCGLLERASDRAYIARELDCDPSLIGSLGPLEYIEKGRGVAQITHGKLRF